MTRSFPMGSVIIIIAATFLAAAGCRGLNCYPATAEVALAAVGRTETYTIWQLPAQTHTQMMAYVLRTAGGRVVVIDGGTKGDAPYLKGFLAALGNRVDAWFITHSHGDHAGALTALLEQSAAGPTDAGAANGPAISAIYAALPPEDRLAQFDKGALETQRAFLAAVAAAGRSVTTLSLGQVIEVDGLRFEILGVAHPEIEKNFTNNQSLVMRMTSAGPAVLFLADLGVEGGRKLLNGPYGMRLRTEIVQMAHHGQNGVDENFYRAVVPRVCLWPTPRWLWTNDQGKGPGTGPWATLTVRGWIERLGVTENHVSADRLWRMDWPAAPPSATRGKETR